MSEFSVEQEHFAGPLGLLLDLLNRKELEIKHVALASIADEYLTYLEEHQPPTEELADFLVVASRLIYVKSRELMPYLRVKEEDDQLESLEDQLRLYRMFAKAADKFEELYRSPQVLSPRPFVRVKKLREDPSFRGLMNVHIEGLDHSFKQLLKRLAPFFALQQTSMERIKSVEERLEELTGAIRTRASMKFKEVVQGARSKAEVVVSFLALLELARRQIVRVTQKQDSDILIERV